MFSNYTQPKSSKSYWLITFFISIIVGVIWYFIPHPLIIITIGIIPISVYYSLNNPFLIVLLFVIFSFFRIHEVFPFLYDFKIPKYLSIISLTAFIWQIFIHRRIQLFWCREFTLITAFTMIIISGIFFAIDRRLALESFLDIYSKIIVMTFAVAILIQRPQQLALTLKAIIISGLIVAITAIYNRIKGIGLVEGTRTTIGRDLGSMLGDPNDLALVLMFPISFSIALLLTHQVSWPYRLFGLIVTIILFCAVIFTQSRGGLLGIIAVFGIYGLQRVKSKILLISSAAITGIILFTIAGIADRTSGGSAEVGIDESSMGRLYAWQAAFKMAIANPLSGVGLSNFYPNFFFFTSYWDGMNHAVHSTWLSVLAETGFIGLGIFVSLIIILIKNIKLTLQKLQQYKNQVDPVIYVSAQGVYAGLIGTIVSGTFLTQGFTWPIYILAALIISINNISKRVLDKLEP
ncbi:oligosaccharide repeat unit polymerase [Photobacterium kishitanii]|uniref:O-antigen ligase family protein n=1 Tax=Photobacterium kishitanii TaxID=318456 RepID=UPI0005D317A7|nr:O-antigen ligase family protein [Photobacterium kishitanii]KJG11529.1 membrane protein [Photobacterium kishitanii]PSV06069.1 oligosaccharide repeat unit polymerase [Photobacterium kishitanii]PSV74739.1 oligosaccharide repeat unit polymerase [Photobacterium kishitanii]